MWFLQLLQISAKYFAVLERLVKMRLGKIWQYELKSQTIKMLLPIRRSLIALTIPNGTQKENRPKISIQLVWKSLSNVKSVNFVNISDIFSFEKFFWWLFSLLFSDNFFELCYPDFPLISPSFFQKTGPIQNEKYSHQEQINAIANSLVKEAEEFRNYQALSKKQRKSQKPEFLGEHEVFLENIIKQLRYMNVPKSMSTSTLTYVPHSSTPYRSNSSRKPLAFSIGSQIANSSQFCWNLKKKFTKFI